MDEVRPARNIGLLALLTAASGALYSIVFGAGTPVIGAVFALFIGLPIMAFERGIVFTRLNERIHALSTPAYILVTLLLNTGLMVLGFGIAAILLRAGGRLHGRFHEVAVVPREVVLYSFFVFFASAFVLRVRELLGHEVFVSLLTGRYRRPLREERVFLFLDLAGSTAYAEAHGDLAAQAYLRALFASLAEPVRRHKGAIDDYIGDAAIVTWPLARGTEGARCLLCVFDILDHLAAEAPHWQARFGAVPQLRAALHGGPIVTAEIGVDHRKITFFGDTVNTTARLEQLSRSLGRSVVISTELLHRMPLPDGILAEDMGSHALRGRGQAVGVTALAHARHAAPPAPAPPASGQAARL